MADAATCTETAWFSHCHTVDEEHRLRLAHLNTNMEIAEQRIIEAKREEAKYTALANAFDPAHDIVHGAFRKVWDDTSVRSDERLRCVTEDALELRDLRFMAAECAKATGYRQAMELKTRRRKEKEVDKKYFAARHWACDEYAAVVDPARERFWNHDNAVIVAAREAFERVANDEVKCVAEMLARGRKVAYVLPPEVLLPLRELEASWLRADKAKEDKAAELRKAAAEADARVRLVQFRIKRVKGSSRIVAHLRPARGLRKRR
jgi:hypothetical protein